MKYDQYITEMREHENDMRTGAAKCSRVFAELLCNLSEDADKQADLASQTADKNLSITNKAYIVSIIALFISILQFLHIPESALRSFDNNANQKGTNLQQSGSNKLMNTPSNYIPFTPPPTPQRKSTSALTPKTTLNPSPSNSNSYRKSAPFPSAVQPSP